MIERITLTVDGRTYSLLQEQPTITLDRRAEMSLEVHGSEPQYGVEIKCFLVYPPPPTYTGCGACGSLRVPDGHSHYFTIEGDTYERGQGRLEFVVNDFVGTIVRVAAVMQRALSTMV